MLSIPVPAQLWTAYFRSTCFPCGLMEPLEPQPLLLFSPSPLRCEALRLVLLYHADLPVVSTTSLVEAHRRLRSGICRAFLLDQTVLIPGTLALVENLTHRQPRLPLGILVPPSAAAYAPLFLSLRARVILNTEASMEEFLMGIGALLRGESFLSPPFPEAICTALTAQLPHRRLSVREWQIFLLLLHGKSYAEIGRLLGIEPKTASTYRSRLARKLGCTSRAELFQYAYTHGLLHELTSSGTSGETPVRAGEHPGQRGGQTVDYSDSQTRGRHHS